MPPDAAGDVLLEQHRRAVRRRRRIVALFDVLSLGPVPMRDVAAWRAKTFLCFDQPGSQVDAIWWDCDWANDESSVAVGGSHPVLGPYKELVDHWRRERIDWPAIFVEETHRRGWEAFWSHRINEVDHGNPLKAAHPDWVVKTWHAEGLWNLAVPEVRAMKTAELRRLAERAAFCSIGRAAAIVCARDHGGPSCSMTLWLCAVDAPYAPGRSTWARSIRWPNGAPCARSSRAAQSR